MQSMIESKFLSIEETQTAPNDRPSPSDPSNMMARYQRQILLPEVGVDGQERLFASRVLIVGAGALGSAAATYLCAAGVGTLGLVDGDTVDASNLHRQILHDTQDIGAPKTRSGAKRLKALNPDVRIEEHQEFLSKDNIIRLFSAYDLIVNGSDNFPTRYLVNDASVLLHKPLVDAAILKFEGQLAVFRPGMGCYRCLFPSPPPPGTVPDCAEAGILGAVAGVLGSMQAVEALKLLLGIFPSTAQGTFLLYDALSSSWQRMAFQPNPDCVICGDHPTITELIDYEDFCGSRLPSTINQPAAIPASEFAVNADQALDLLADPTVIAIDVRGVDEFRCGHIPGTQPCSMEDLPDIARTAANRRILVICASGVRSAYAAETLRSLGCHAWTLQEGTNGWNYAGGPWVSSEPPAI